ncbi:unnamed protein product [Lota lota]
MFRTNQSPTQSEFFSVAWKFKMDNIITSTTTDIINPEYSFRINLNKKTGSLELLNLTLDDSGPYTVFLIPLLGLHLNGDCNLQVYEPVSSVTVTPNTTELLEFSSSVSMSCNVSTGTSLSYLWMNGSSEITVSSVGVQISDGNTTLTVLNVTRYDRGPYQCRVFNPVSSETSDPLTLHPSYGPDHMELRGNGQNISDFILGSDLNVSCSAQSNPSAQFQWAFQGDVLTTTGPDLKLYSVSKKHSGMYSCLAYNNVTQMYSNITKSINIELISNVTVRVSAIHLVEFNDSAVFTCSVSRGSSLSYVWTNNGSVVTNADNGVLLSGEGAVLTIANVTRNDRGPFMCQVFNGVSNGSSAHILLNISYGPSNPKMITSPMMVGYKTGSNITLSCLAESNPPATVQWFFNEMDLSLFGPEIQLKHTKENQTGFYKCVLYNAVTSRYNSVQTMVRIMDPISHVAVSRAGGPVILGQSVTLSCDVNETVESILWWKNGTMMAHNITSLSNKSLTLDPVSQLDAGEYKCQAFNSVSNMTSSPYRLIVNYGPETPVIQGPSAALAGQPVTLKCSALSEPPSQYSWYFNSSLVANSSEYDTKPLTMDTKYICMAFNNITGRNTTAYTMLIVYDPITNVQVNGHSNSAVKGLSFTLTCNATGVVEHVSWIKNGEMLYTDNTTSLSMHNHTLTFNPLNEKDNGYYQCTAANAVSNMTSPIYGLHVIFGPYTPIIAGPLEAETGDNVVFNCSASSYPPSYYHWYYKETLVGNNSMFETGPLSLNMSGEYTCMAINNVTGENRTSLTTLGVIKRIERVMIKEDSLPIQSHNFTLSCEVAGPYDSIYWTKNRIPLGALNSSTNESHMSYRMKNNSLHFSPVMTYDDGVYQCVAKNVVREHSSPEHELLVNYGPWNVSIEGPEEVQADPNAKVQFTCSAKSRPTSQYQWFNNSSPTAMGDGSQLTISVKTPSVVNYTCKVYNNVTKISMSKNKTLTTSDHSLASPGALLFMILAALSVPMLGN